MVIIFGFYVCEDVNKDKMIKPFEHPNFVINRLEKIVLHTHFNTLVGEYIRGLETASSPVQFTNGDRCTRNKSGVS